MISFVVGDIDASLATFLKLGGKILQEPRGEAGQGHLAILQNPSGAVAVLIQLDTD